MKNISYYIKILAKKLNEGSYVWQETEKGDAKTLMYKSPETGKKYHVSPSASAGKMTVDQYNEFKKKFDKDRAGEAKPFSPALQRFGQAFCNKFGIHDQKLFYEKDEKKAEELIWSKYIKV
jgi:hypothetical protein